MRIKCLLMACLLIFGIACFSGCNKSSGSEPKATEIIITPKPVVFVGCVDYPYYDSLDKLYEDTDLIVRGMAVSSTVETISYDTDDELSTIYAIEIYEVYKGEAGDTINLLQYGGETEDQIFIMEGQDDVELNVEYIMFLHYSSSYENSAWLMNDGQSLYEVDENTSSWLQTEFGLDD